MRGARLRPLAHFDGRDDAGQLSSLVEFVGYRPRALLTMAGKPGLLAPLLGLVHVVLRAPGAVPERLRFLVACETCRVAGCAYSAAHAVHAAQHVGLTLHELSALGQAEAATVFSASEQAALALATAGGTLPVRASADAFTAAASHFAEAELLDIVSVISLFGWFNRWNSLVGTELEPEPAAVVPLVPWLSTLYSQGPHGH